MSKVDQVAEFQSLYFKAYGIFMKADSEDERSLLQIFANLAYGGVPKSAPIEKETAAPESKAEEEGPEEQESQAKVEQSEVKEQPNSARVPAGGKSSIVFGDDSMPTARSSTRVRQPAGGQSSIQFGGPTEVQKVKKSSTRVRVAPGGSSSLQLGGPALEKDNTRKKKKEEIAHVNVKPMLSARQMAGNEMKSSVFAETKPKPASDSKVSASDFDPEINKALLGAVVKFDKLRNAYMELVGDSGGKSMSKATFKEGCQRIQVDVTDDYVDKFFATYDKKGSGSVGFSGFVRFMNKITPA